jgi:hypothetical protein
MKTADDNVARVRPSGRNGNRLPLRMPGERMAGRQKGTRNKIPPGLEEAVIAAAAAIGTPKRVGKLWVATGEGGPEGFLAWVLLTYPKVAVRLFSNLIVLEEESLKRAHAKARASFVKELLKLLMIPVELKPSHKTAHPSHVIELLEVLTGSVARKSSFD